MTIAEALKQEGYQIGREEGLHEGVERGRYEGKLEGEHGRCAENCTADYRQRY